MTRQQSTNVYNAATANSKTDAANAASSFGGTNAALGDYSKRVNDFIAADPYKAGGQYEQAEKTITGSRASADSNALRNELALTAQRSGENSASYAPALAKATRDATIDAQTAQSQAEADRLNKETGYTAQGVEMSKFPVQTQEGLYSTSLGARNSSLNTAGNAAASNRSFGDTFGQAFASELGRKLLGSQGGGAGAGDGGGPQYG